MRKVVVKKLRATARRHMKDSPTRYHKQPSGQIVMDGYRARFQSLKRVWRTFTRPDKHAFATAAVKS